MNKELQAETNELDLPPYTYEQPHWFRDNIARILIALLMLIPAGGLLLGIYRYLRQR